MTEEKLCTLCRKNKISIDEDLCLDCMIENIVIEDPRKRYKKHRSFWKWYDKHMVATTGLAVVIAFGMNLPHIIWLDWLAFSGGTIFDTHAELDIFMVAVEHIELLPLGKIIFDGLRILKRKRKK